MPKEIIMPKLGESVVEGTIGKWLKKVGDPIELDEALVEVDTDKVNAEVPSPYAGTIEAIVAQEGETVPVGGVIAVIREVSEGASEAEEQSRVEDDPVAHDADRAASGTGDAKAITSGSLPYSVKEPHRYSPSVRRLAGESGIDPAQVRGTGAKGRVTKQDMERAIIERRDRAAAYTAAPAVSASSRGASDYALTAEGDEVVPITRLRRTIAERMVHSKQTVPHAWTTVEVDVSSLVSWRESIKEEFRKREGINLTYLPFVVKAAVEALREFPILNSTWEEERIVIKKHIHIGIAVDLDDGLIVPVIRDADQKSIVGLARDIADLATRARSGSLKPDDVSGGTFTVNNTGSFGSVLSAPIINYPQAAILSMETITKRPVVVGDAIAIRSMMNLCMSLDHRVLDGAVCGRFLRSVKARLESYDSNTPLY